MRITYFFRAMGGRKIDAHKRLFLLGKVKVSFSFLSESEHVAFVQDVFLCVWSSRLMTSL